MIQKDLDPVRLHVNEKLVLVFRSCEHFESRGCDKPALQEVNNVILKMGKDHRVKVFELGDMMTLVSRKDKRWNDHEIDSRFYTPEIQAEPGPAIADIFVEEVLDPIKPYIEGVLMGNHEYVYQKNALFKPCRHICERLFGKKGTAKKYLGYTARVILPVRVNDETFRIPIYLNHGFGGGVTRTKGGDITTFCNHCQQYNADINVYGHRHKTWYFEDVRWVREGQDIHEFCVMCAGTFLKTLSEDEEPYYSEQHGYPVYPIGCMSIHLVARKRGRNNYYLERFAKKLPQGRIE